MLTVQELGLRAKAVTGTLASAGTAAKNRALEEMAKSLEQHADAIYQANAADVEAAKAGGMRASLLDRLTLTPKRLAGAVAGVRDVAAQEDPVGVADGGGMRPNGLRIERRRVPLGVVGIIYEARPNVTVDAAALCLKSGNVCILRGGREAIRTNIALMEAMRAGVKNAGLPEDVIALCEDTDRRSAHDMMTATGLLDVLIPRGGAGLIRAVIENARVPVIETGTGICHVYADDGCDPEMAVHILVNAKCSRPSVCNAVEVFLCHSSMAERILPAAYDALAEYGVELRCDARAYQILGGCERVVPASDADFYTEFLDYILAVKIVDTLDEALREINTNGTGHSECIVTESYTRADAFLEHADAAAVYVNASTRFTDGGEFGLGAEIGISTQKLHARGPMGLTALTTFKYTIRGSGQIRV